jgi:diguanylate cyclase (GGDEF)-like protein
MKEQHLYLFLHKQIPVMLGLSLVPGLGYLFLGWLHGIMAPALLWYVLVVLVSVWGFRLHRSFLYEHMNNREKAAWYKELTYFFYMLFSLWTLIFLLYANETESNLHFIAIFTQIGASVVASTILVSDRRLFIPVLLILMVPLIVYFSNIGAWYGYVLSLFATIFTGVLFYASYSSFKLLQKTHFQASHDQLTGLYNRHFFVNFLQQKINALTKSKMYHYLLLIDLDHFKTINDSLGHDIGDLLLQEVASRIKLLATEEQEIARLGGDEFVVLGHECSDKERCAEQAVAFSEQLLAALKETYVVERHHLYISASIGVSLIGDSKVSANSFIKEADIAMYEVKAQGRNGVILFSDTLSKRVESHLEIERLLHFALEKKEITLHYQPQYDRDKKIIGCEVLVRWQNEQLGSVSPAVFIPVAEQTGLIIELGNYILEESFKTLREWDKRGIALQQFAINISMRQFLHHSFIGEIERLSALYLDKRLNEKVTFEMTETVVAEDIRKVIIVMEQIKRMGIKFSMDDFGTGYSSLSYLRQIPVDELKIDRSFVNELNKNESDRAMVSTILNMAEIFKLGTVAEGVESAEQFDFLVKHRCVFFQGYHLSRPLDKKRFETLYFTERKQTTQP